MAFEVIEGGGLESIPWPEIAQQLYNLYHREPAQAAPDTLEAVIAALNPAQLDRLRAAIR